MNFKQRPFDLNNANEVKNQKKHHRSKIEFKLILFTKHLIEWLTDFVAHLAFIVRYNVASNEVRLSAISGAFGIFNQSVEYWRKSAFVIVSKLNLLSQNDSALCWKILTQLIDLFWADWEKCNYMKLQQLGGKSGEKNGRNDATRTEWRAMRGKMLILFKQCATVFGLSDCSHAHLKAVAFRKNTAD